MTYFNRLCQNKVDARLIPWVPILSDAKWSGGSAFCTCRLCVQSKLPTDASVRWWNLPDTAFKLALCLELKLYRRKLNVGKIPCVILTITPIVRAFPLNERCDHFYVQENGVKLSSEHCFFLYVALFINTIKYINILIPFFSTFYTISGNKTHTYILWCL